MRKLRSFQQEFLDIIENKTGGNDILVNVTPGGGKSHLPVLLANVMEKNNIDYIIWIVPRSLLKQQAIRSGKFRDYNDIMVLAHM